MDTARSRAREERKEGEFTKDGKGKKEEWERKTKMERRKER